MSNKVKLVETDSGVDCLGARHKSEVWQLDGGPVGIYVDYNDGAVLAPTGPETMAFPAVFRKDGWHVTSWAELCTFRHDATGGEAVRYLGYEVAE